MAEVDLGVLKQATFDRWWRESGYELTGQKAIDNAQDGTEALVSEVFVREVVFVAKSAFDAGYGAALERAERLEKEWRLEARNLLSFLKADAEAYIADWPEAYPHFNAALEEE